MEADWADDSDGCVFPVISRLVLLANGTP